MKGIWDLAVLFPPLLGESMMILKANKQKTKWFLQPEGKKDKSFQLVVKSPAQDPTACG